MKKEQKNKPELLSPAGDFECFRAAVSAGADAIYAGGEKFGARAYAGNFTTEELLLAINEAHLYGRRFYLTVNTILKNDETGQLYDYIAPLYEAGLDAVIVQDIGVINMLTRNFPDLPLHASTQMAVTDTEGVLLLKDMGIKRVVPARELSLSEIERIIEETGTDLECFIHGALCYSYSGKCLFSSILGGRSGNRGRCAQPCRLPYNNRYILSARDISTLEMLPELIEAGIASFKIEGRMKSKEYVAGVTGIYRKYIDRYLSTDGSDFSVEETDIKDLDDIYTRSGHCSGYYHEHNGRNMITVDKPSYSSADKERLEQLYQKYTAYSGKTGILCEVTAKKGERLLIKLVCGEQEVLYRGETVEAAKTRPMDKDDIRKQISKLGDTCFELKDLKILSDNDIFIPVSSLNRARREAVGSLKETMLSHFLRKSPEKYDIKEDPGIQAENIVIVRPYVNCRIDRLNMLDVVLKYEFIDIVTLDIGLLQKLERDDRIGLIKTIKDAGKQLFIAFPPVIRNAYFKRNEFIGHLLEDGIADAIEADNYESLYYLKTKGYKGRIVSDLHLYAANDEAVTAYKNLGVDVITYPVELNRGELNKLRSNCGEFILYGRLPMMVSAQCTKKTLDRCVKDNGISYIKDRYGNDFPCVRNCDECYNTILNCVPLMITSTDQLPENVHPFSYRIHFTTEEEEEIKDVLNIYGDVFDGKKVSAEDIKHTLGHLKRGVE